MNFRWDKKYLYWGITAFFVICASICFYYLLFHSNNLWKGISTVINIAMPIIDGFVLAYILSPVVNHIERKLLYPAYRHSVSTDKQEIDLKARKRLRKIRSIINQIIFTRLKSTWKSLQNSSGIFLYKTSHFHSI